jgi:hypothetical protein
LRPQADSQIVVRAIQKANVVADFGSNSDRTGERLETSARYTANRVVPLVFGKYSDLDVVGLVLRPKRGCSKQRQNDGISPIAASCLGSTAWVVYVLVHSRPYLAENAENVVAQRAIQMRTGPRKVMDAGFRTQSTTTTLAKDDLL